ncbi:reverse transcriptase family protein [Leifsonia sp. H3M29-4]|nr:reverse transcriptase family protein [Salinibacterium metalliresistens]MDF1479409.1 reverse transcriptase family protein [Salinibacterium metalliresistens]
MQRWLLHHSVAHARTHDSSYAYQPGRSVVQCATRHLGASWFVKIDIKDYFHSFDETQVFSVFVELGYSRLVAFELSRLCTRRAPGDASWLPPKFRRQSSRRYESMGYRPTTLGYLPQGAPTSGFLANVLTRMLDLRLSNIAGDFGLVYTRYADDIVLSGSSPFSRPHAERIMRMAITAVRRAGFAHNIAKSRIVGPGSRLAMLGLLIDGERVRLTRQTRSRIETHVRGVERFGLQTHASHRGFDDDFGFLNHIYGLLDYANDVDRDFATRYRERLQEALRNRTRAH